MTFAPRDGLDWTREEVVFALGLYFQIPWGKINQRNPAVIQAAQLLGRTPGSLGRKMGNLGRFDPTLAARGVGGLKNGAKIDEAVWNEFVGHRDLLAVEYARVRAKLGGEEATVASDDLIKTPPGLEGVHLAKYRKDQSFFRSSVLSAYNGSCCITGIGDPRLLVADHIKPIDKCVTDDERMNVQNGICLSSLYDSAFTQGLITVDPHYHVILSSSLQDHMTKATYRDFFLRYDNQKITLPHRGQPAAEFLTYHNEYVFVA